MREREKKERGKSQLWLPKLYCTFSNPKQQHQQQQNKYNLKERKIINV